MGLTLDFFQFSGISMSSQRLWRPALQQCQLASLTPSGGYCQGPVICRGQAPIILYTPAPPSLTVGGCFHQHGFLIPSSGTQQCWWTQRWRKFLEVLHFRYCWWLINLTCLTVGQFLASISACSLGTWRALSCVFLTSLSSFSSVWIFAF